MKTIDEIRRDDQRARDAITALLSERAEPLNSLQIERELSGLKKLIPSSALRRMSWSMLDERVLELTPDGRFRLVRGD